MATLLTDPETFKIIDGPGAKKGADTGPSRSKMYQIMSSAFDKHINYHRLIPHRLQSKLNCMLKRWDQAHVYLQ